jgi:CheY-like chemotaxis protein
MMQLSPCQVDPWKDTRSARPLVLVVEDDYAVQEVLSYALAFYGYRAICRPNGLEALLWLEQALRAGEYPQAILLDSVMPVMNGRVFLEHLPHSWSAPTPIPPVILSTVDPNYRHDDLACSKVLLKPFHMYELRECLNMVRCDAMQTGN